MELRHLPARVPLRPLQQPSKECNCSFLHHPLPETHQWPLLDRINIHIQVLLVDYEKLAGNRVQTARERHLQGFISTKLTRNAEMSPSQVRDFCTVEPSAEKSLKAAMQQLHLSAKAFHRVLKLACTIADLAGSDLIAANHLAGAIQYRPRVGM